jgi:starvation-inducible DNA-binding protein
MTAMDQEKARELRNERQSPLHTPTDLSAAATRDISGTMNAVVADVFAMYIKTKNRRTWFLFEASRHA